MKKVVKVSVANLAFTIEEDGYEILRSYLGELKAHYRTNPNGNEIIEGIEERIAELFLEKSGKDIVVTSDVVKEVINILGRPEMIDPEGEQQNRPERENTQENAQKRLFRDPSDKILGGVCSGLAAYSGIDRVLVRVLFVVIFFGFSAFGFHMGGGSFIVLAYIVLWLIVPEARTFEQRCAMHGDKPDLTHIRKRVENEIEGVGKGIRRNGNGREVANTLFSILVKIFAVILIFMALSGLVLLSLFLLGIEIFQGLIPIDMFDYIRLGLINPFWLKLSFLLVMFLPLVGMLYTGIQALFGFRSGKFRMGLVIFILWVISLFTFIGFSVKASTPYWSNSSKEIFLPVKSSIDTIYIKLASPNPIPDSKVFMEADISEISLFWFDNNANRRDFVVFPELKIVRQSETEEPEIRSVVYTTGNTYADAKIYGEKLSPFVELKDSLLTISADVINREQKWDGTVKKIALYIPERVKVIV
ncbi:MAG: PspC domain-containing protein, partial [Bacteroidales bacterium]|nr:PspC domain-containing protein [Bacteroidales bacterium]